MPKLTLSAAVGGVGIFLAAAALVAAVNRAPLPAAVFGGLALAHVLVAVRGRESRLVAICGGLLGLAEIALVAIGLWFIVGIELGLGRVDLGDAWFAPLNGYGALAVAAAIVGIAAGMVRQAVVGVVPGHAEA
jgi:hypothetical protein